MDITEAKNCNRAADIDAVLMYELRPDIFSCAEPTRSDVSSDE
jgi:hypothetical protein